MQEVLKNLAAIHLLAFCRENNIDPSGSYVIKAGRGFIYNLVDQQDYSPFVTVRFAKNNVPQFSWNDAARTRGAK